VFHTRSVLACERKEKVKGNGYKRDKACEREMRRGRGYTEEKEGR